MSKRNWKGAFGPTPEAFAQKISFALKQAKEERPVKKIKMATVVALALTVVLLAAAAYAAAVQWGLFSFWEYRQGLQVPEAAKNALTTHPPQTGGESADVAFTVREALYDGMQLNIIVEARPKAPGKLLLMGALSPDDLISNAGPAYEGDARTFAQAAAQEGKRLLEVSVNAAVNGVSVVNGIDSLAEEDGAMVLHLSGPLHTKEENIHVVCSYALLEWQDAKTPLSDTMARGEFSFDLPANISQTEAKYSGPVPIENTGAAVEDIVLTKTDAGVYARITFSLSPEATEAQAALFRDGLWFEFLDANGERIQSGISSEGEISGLVLPDGTVSDTILVQTESLALAEFPESLTLRGYDCWEKTRFGQHTFIKDK